MLKNSFAKFAVSLGIGVSLLYFTVRYFDTEKTLMMIQTANSGGLFIAFLLILTAYLIRGYRWIVWEKALNYRDSFKLILVGFMGNNIFPARLGEILRAHCAADKTGEEYGRTAALASITIERIIDGLVLAVIGILGLVFVSVSRTLFHALMTVSVLFFILTAGLIIGTRIHSRIRAFLEWLNSIFPGHLTSFGKEKANFFLDGLMQIGSFYNIVFITFITCMIWGIELIAYYMIANSVFHGISLKICMLFLSVTNFASLFPFTVGGIGAIEGATTVFLVGAGIPANPALAMVIIQHLLQFGLTTILGGIYYFTEGYYKIPIFQPSDKKQAMRQNVLQDDERRRVFDDTRKRLECLSSDMEVQLLPQKQGIYLSIVIPAYNEQRRLPRTVLETIEWCKKNLESYEIIISDDGSSDETLNLSRLFAKQIPEVRFITNCHLGKGATVRLGMLNASGKYVLFMDADGATPLDEIPKLIAKADKGADVVIGSRISQQDNDVQVVTSIHRKIIGRIFAALVNIFAISGFADTQCGFKLFRRERLRDIFLRQKINGFAFDVEILYLAKKLSLSIAEVPVNWENQQGSKVNIITDSVKMLSDILRIRWIHKSETFASDNPRIMQDFATETL